MASKYYPYISVESVPNIGIRFVVHWSAAKKDPFRTRGEAEKAIEKFLEK